MRPVPRYAYLMATLSALLAFAIFCVLSLHSARANSFPLALAIALCMPLGTAFSLIWSNASWRWGLWVSSGFWLFLGVVFFSFLAESQLEWMPAVEAVTITALSCVGAFFGRWLSLRIRGIDRPTATRALE